MGMRTCMWGRLVALGVVLLVTALGQGAELRLKNEKAMFPLGEVNGFDDDGDPSFVARISPAGTHLLFGRRAAAPAGAHRSLEYFDLILRDLATDAEVVLPVGPIQKYRGMDVVRFNRFDPEGRRLVLAKDDATGPDERPKRRIVIYEIATAKLTPMELPEPKSLLNPRFDRSGEGLLMSNGRAALTRFSLGAADPKDLSARGQIAGISGRSDLATVYRPWDDLPNVRLRQRGADLLLWDLGKDQQIAKLSGSAHLFMHDLEAQWTPDGRFVAFPDIPRKGEGGVSVARIYDTNEGRPVAAIRNAMPIGTGPTPGAVLLSRYSGPPFGQRDVQSFEMLFHDAHTGRTATLGRAGDMLIHATGKRAIYSRDVNGIQTVHIADLGIDADE